MKIYDMELAKKMEVSEEVKRRVESVVLECLVTAQRVWGESVVNRIPEIRYNTIGKAAGWACYNGGNPYIDINPVLFNENVEHVINQTVPHEVAHLVVDMVWGRANVRPHGKEWAYVMRVFGKEADRCHDMDVSSIDKIRNRRVYVYKCGCMEHKMSSIKHKRLVNGVMYICKLCKGKLVFHGEKV